MDNEERFIVLLEVLINNTSTIIKKLDEINTNISQFDKDFVQRHDRRRNLPRQGSYC